jgi:hypothetical protein
VNSAGAPNRDARLAPQKVVHPERGRLQPDDFGPTQVLPTPELVFWPAAQHAPRQASLAAITDASQGE